MWVWVEDDAQSTRQKSEERKITRTRTDAEGFGGHGEQQLAAVSLVPRVQASLEANVGCEGLGGVADGRELLA